MARCGCSETWLQIPGSSLLETGSMQVHPLNLGGLFFCLFSWLPRPTGKGRCDAMGLLRLWSLAGSWLPWVHRAWRPPWILKSRIPAEPWLPARPEVKGASLRALAQPSAGWTLKASMPQGTEKLPAQPPTSRTSNHAAWWKDCCFTPPSFGLACHTARDHWHTSQPKLSVGRILRSKKAWRGFISKTAFYHFGRF